MPIGLALAKIKYEQQLKNLLEKAFKATYGGNNTDIGDAMAEAFASKAAPKIADAVKSFFENAHIVGVIPVKGEISFTGLLPSMAMGSFTVAPNNLQLS